MGVQNLWKILEPVGRRVDIATLRNRTVAVDASIWLTAFIKAMRNAEGEVIPNAHLIGTFRRIMKLMMFRIRPIFVFDGGVPTVKKRTILRRQERRAANESTHANLLRKIILKRARDQMEAKADSPEAEGATSQATPPRFTARSQRQDGGIEERKGEDTDASPAAATSTPKRRRTGASPSSTLSSAGSGDARSSARRSSVTSAGSRSSSADDDLGWDTGAQPMVPEDTSAIDMSVVGSLPPQLQKEFIEEMQRKRRNTARGRLLPVAADPVTFSKQQINTFLDIAKFNKSIDELNAQQARKVHGHKIASEANREYLLVVDKGEDGAEHQTISLTPATAGPSLDQLSLFALSTVGGKRFQKGRKRSQFIPKINNKTQQMLQSIEGTLKGASPGLLGSSLDKLQARSSLSSALSGVDTSCAALVPADKLQPSPSRDPAACQFVESEHDVSVDIRPVASEAPVVEETPIADSPSRSPPMILSSHAETRQQQPPQSPSCVELSELDDEGGGFLPDSPNGLSLPSVPAAPASTSPTIWDVYARKLGSAVPPDGVEAAIYVGEHAPMVNAGSSSLHVEQCDVTQDSVEEEWEEVQPLRQFHEPSPNAETGAPTPPPHACIDMTGDKGSAGIIALMSDAEGDPPAAEQVMEHRSDHVQHDDQHSSPTSAQSSIKALNTAYELAGEMHSWAQFAFRRAMNQMGVPLSRASEDLPSSVSRSAGAGTEAGGAEADLAKHMRAASRDADTVSDTMRDEVIALLELFGLPHIIAPMEAEAQCAALEQVGLVDGVITDDSDAFLFGARHVYRNIFDDKKYVEMYAMDDVERELGLCRDDLVRSALLLGSDYTDGVAGVGPVNATEILAAFPGDEGLVTFREWLHGVDVCADGPELQRQFQKKHKAARKNWVVSENFPSSLILEAYRNPKVVTLDSKSHQFAETAPDFDAISLVCQERFGWLAAKAKAELQPLMKELQNKEHQTTLDRFMLTYEDQARAAKIKSKRLKDALLGLSAVVSNDMLHNKG